MSQKSDLPVLLASLVVTAGLLGGGYWWFTHKGSNPTRLLIPNAQNPVPGQPSSTGATFATVQGLPAGRFNYGGSTSWAPIRKLIDPALQQAHPQFQLRYVDPLGRPPGSGEGIKMVLNDELDFSQSARPISDREYEQAKQRGITLKQIAIAIDGIAIAVNPSLNIPGITTDQLAGIYKGQITNWQQVGGPNLPITPITRPESSGGTVELFLEQILQGQRFGPGVKRLGTTTEALRELGRNPGGIYYASAPEVVPQCSIKPLPIGRKPQEWVPPYQEPLVPQSACPQRVNQLNVVAFQSGQYPLTRNFFVVLKQNGRVEQLAGEAYANLLLTDQGQNLITQAGFVRIR